MARPAKAPVLENPLGEKPLPEARPGTSGTMNVLVNNRRQASHNLQKAQRAERVYKAKKGATAARRDYQFAKDHYKKAFHHFKEGIKGTGRLLKLLPCIIREKNEQRHMEADQKRKARALRKKQQLEERLAREAENSNDGEDEAAEPET
ncbi:hypothetical protein HJFPF1_00572 [Paramyrothecium foliicola]|nr:hypothetical protein HJFPF1_00572 [Paramyrothecium foliicola]